MKKAFVAFVLIWMGFSCVFAQVKQKDLGALYPKRALEYMKQRNNIVIIDVSSEKFYDKKHFAHALNIPIEAYSDEELQKILMTSIPKNRPVIVHCRQGVIGTDVYMLLKKVRPDLPEISYIAGKPLFDEYNAWVERE